MCSTLLVLLVLLNTVVGKSGKDKLGRTWEICKTYKVLVRNLSRGSHFDYPDTKWGMTVTFQIFRY